MRSGGELARVLVSSVQPQHSLLTSRTKYEVGLGVRCFWLSDVPEKLELLRFAGIDRSLKTDTPLKVS